MKKELKISAIREGTAIDHIPSNVTFKVAEILDLRNHKGIVSVATGLASKKLRKKGIIKIGGKYLTQEEVNKIAILAPHATVNIIKNYDVREKLEVKVPKSVEKIIKCSNPKCITNNEPVSTKFYILTESPLKVKCHYCERCMSRKDVELI